jgi:hypothetical protein
MLKINEAAELLLILLKTFERSPKDKKPTIPAIHETCFFLPKVPNRHRVKPLLSELNR